MRSSSEGIPLVVLDRNVPEMSGIEFRLGREAGFARVDRALHAGLLVSR